MLVIQVPLSNGAGATNLLSNLYAPYGMDTDSQGTLYVALNRQGGSAQLLSYSGGTPTTITQPGNSLWGIRFLNGDYTRLYGAHSVDNTVVTMACTGVSASSTPGGAPSASGTGAATATATASASTPPACIVVSEWWWC